MIARYLVMENAWEPVEERKIGMDDLWVVAELVGMVSSDLCPRS